jgi:hypothetical protein
MLITFIRYLLHLKKLETTDKEKQIENMIKYISLVIEPFISDRQPFVKKRFYLLHCTLNNCIFLPQNDQHINARRQICQKQVRNKFVRKLLVRKTIKDNVV